MRHTKKVVAYNCSERVSGLRFLFLYLYIILYDNSAFFSRGFCHIFLSVPDFVFGEHQFSGHENSMIEENRSCFNGGGLFNFNNCYYSGK